MYRETADPTRTGKKSKSVVIVYKGVEKEFRNVTRVEETGSFVRVTTRNWGTMWFPIPGISSLREFDS